MVRNTDPRGSRLLALGLVVLVVVWVLFAELVFRTWAAGRIADVAGGSPRTAATLAWALAALPLWTAIAYNLGARCFRGPGQGVPVWAWVLWVPTFIPSMAFIPPRGSKDDWNAELARAAGALGRPIGTGGFVGGMGWILLAILLGALYSGARRIGRRLRGQPKPAPFEAAGSPRWRRLMSGRSETRAVLGALVLVQVLALLIMLTLFDLGPDRAALAAAARAQNGPALAGTAPARSSLDHPDFAGRGAPRAAELVPLPSLALNSDGAWDRLAIADAAGCTAVTPKAAVAVALSAAGCRSTARVLLADPGRGLVAALSVMEAGSPEQAKALRLALYPPVFAGAAAAPLPLPPDAPAVVRAAYGSLTASGAQRRSAVESGGLDAGVTVAVITVAGSADEQTLRAAESALGGLVFGFDGYTPVRPRQVGPDVRAPRGAELFPARSVELSERGTWRRLQVLEEDGCAHASADAAIVGPLQGAGCRHNSVVLLWDRSRQLLAVLASTDVDGAEERARDRVDLAYPLAPPLRPANGSAPDLRAAFRTLRERPGFLDTTGPIFDDQSRAAALVRIWVAGPAASAGARQDGVSELARWVSRYLYPLRPEFR